MDGKAPRQRLAILPRDPGVVLARPAPGDHQRQVNNAFARMFDRYERALLELAGR